MTSNHLDEFSEIDLSVAIAIGFTHHVFDVVFRRILTEVLHHTPEIVDTETCVAKASRARADENLLDVATVGSIEHSKGFVQFFDRVGEIHFEGYHR